MMVFKPSKQPEFIQRYRDQTSRSVPRRIPIEELRLVALDTECSGFSVGRDRLLTVSVIEIGLNYIQLDTCVEWLVYQPNIVANKATEIHGILPSEILEGIPEKQMLTELIPRISGTIVVGHQIWFDANMLNEAFRRNFGVPFRNPTIDVGVMAMNELQPFRRSGYINQRPPTLEDLCAHFGLPLCDRHTAEGDAYLAAQIFLLMCGHIRQRKGRILRTDIPIRKA